MTTKPVTSRRAGVLSPGAFVLGEYIIEQLIEQGTTRTTYRARHTRRQGERFVVATMNDVTVDRLELIEAFARQSILLQSLRHPGIVPVVAAGVDSGQVLMVSQEVKGRTLADRLREQKNGLPEGEVVRLVRELAEVFDYLHGHDPAIVHRVLEPKGVLLAATDGAAILKDVGYAHALQVVQVASVEDVVPNAPAPYAAPECDTGRFAGPPADRFSLAAVAYECVHGRPHASANADEETTQQGAQPAVFAIFERALHEDPAKRYPSAGEFAEALGDALSPLKPAGAVAPRIDRTEPIDPREQRRIAAVAGHGLRKKTMIGIAPVGDSRASAPSSPQLAPQVTPPPAAPPSGPTNPREAATLDMPSPPAFDSGRSAAAHEYADVDPDGLSSPSIQVEIPAKLEPALPQVGRGMEPPARAAMGSGRHGSSGSGGYAAASGGYPAGAPEGAWGAAAMQSPLGPPEMLPLTRDPVLRAAVIAAAIISAAIVLAAIIMALVISSAIASARHRVPGASPTAASVMATSTPPTTAAPTFTATAPPTTDPSATASPTATGTTRKRRK